MNMLPSPSTSGDEKHQEIQTQFSLNGSVLRISNKGLSILCSHPLDAELLVAPEDNNKFDPG